MVEGNVVCSKELGICRCNELEEERKKYETKFAEFEVEIQMKNDECKTLETRNKTLEVEKSTIEVELKILKRNIQGLVGNDEAYFEPNTETKGLIDFREVGDEENEVFRLKVENQVLECENKYAESQVEYWKNKYKKLQSQVLQSDMKSDVEKDLTSNMQELGTPSNYTESKKIVCMGSDVRYGQKVRKRLKFEEYVPRKNMAPSTPCSRKSEYPGAVYIIDDDEPNNTTVHVPMLDGGEDRNGSLSKYCAPERSASTENQFKDEEDMDVSEEIFPCIGGLKRKRIGNVFISDSDTDDDDIPISKLKRKHLKEGTSDQAIQVHVDLKSFLMTDTLSGNPTVNHVQPSARRRLIQLCVSKDLENEKHFVAKPENERSNPKNEDFEDNKIEDSSSESEGDSLREFIIPSDTSDNEDPSGHAVKSSIPEDASDEENFTRILSKIRREKNYKMKWEFEGEMLAAFAVDPRLCMKAVCALYRQQTSDEKTSKETLYYNGRGFSKFDAQRGCKMAEFLTNGDPHGDLLKSIEELKEFDPKGIQLCRTLATHYSKQLFTIYQNKEDPLFLP